MPVCVPVCICACVTVSGEIYPFIYSAASCVVEYMGGREKKREKEIEKERDRLGVCVFMREKEGGRERERKRGIYNIYRCRVRSFLPCRVQSPRRRLLANPCREFIRLKRKTDDKLTDSK